MEDPLSSSLLVWIQIVRLSETHIRRHHPSFSLMIRSLSVGTLAQNNNDFSGLSTAEEHHLSSDKPPFWIIITREDTRSLVIFPDSTVRDFVVHHLELLHDVLDQLHAVHVHEDVEEVDHVQLELKRLGDLGNYLPLLLIAHDRVSEEIEHGFLCEDFLDLLQVSRGFLQSSVRLGDVAERDGIAFCRRFNHFGDVADHRSRSKRVVWRGA
nr:hypothetical protein Iba_chr07aCG10190 [Ipomoea batatas]